MRHATDEIEAMWLRHGVRFRLQPRPGRSADRVGLRYAYEAGFDVGQGPRLWNRFREKYGNGEKITNFFFGGHSRPSDRIKNIRRELAINYPDSIR